MGSVLAMISLAVAPYLANSVIATPSIIDREAFSFPDSREQAVKLCKPK
jgi:hypothetical protein